MPFPEVHARFVRQPLLCCLSAALLVVGIFWFTGGRQSAGQQDATEAAALDNSAADGLGEKQRIGRLLRTLQLGMTRQQVEKLLGTPERVIESRDSNYRDVLCAQYRCLPPDLPPLDNGHAYSMLVVYDATTQPLVVAYVCGPQHELCFPETEHP